MPKIPVYESQVSAPRPREDVASELARGGEMIGRTFEQMGQEASDTVSKLEMPELIKRRADIFNETYGKIQDAIKTGNINDPNFMTDLMNNTVGPAVDKLRDGWLSEKAQNAANEQASGMSEWLARHALENVSREAGDRASESLAQMQDDSEKFVAAHPEAVSAKIAEMNDSIDALRNVHGLSADVAAGLQKARPAFLGRITDSALDGVVANAAASNDPQKVQDALKLISDPNSDYYKYSTPAGLAKAQDSLSKVGTTLQSTQSEIAAQTMPDLIAQTKATGNIPDAAKAIAANYVGSSDKETAVKRAEFTRQLEDAEAYGKVAVQVRNMSDQDAQTFIKGMFDRAKSETDPNAIGPERAAWKAATETIEQRDREYRANPGKYMTNPDNDPAVAVAYQAWAKNPTAQGFAAYAARSIAEQKRLFGADAGHIPSVVTDDIRQMAGTAVQNVTSPEGATAAAQSLGQLREYVGAPYWNQVVQELQRDKVLTGDAGVAAALVGRPESQALAENILYASAVSGGNRFGMHQIPEAKATALAIPAFGKLAASLANTGPQGAEMMNSYEQALAHVIQYNGVTDAKSVQVLADKMGQGQFAFPSGQPSLRVPTGIDPDRVADGARSVQSDIGNHNLVVPPSYSALGPKDQRTNYAAQIAATGKWYTNEDGTGALLYDEDMHNVQEIVNGKKVDVELKWDDLGKVADKTVGRSLFRAGASVIDSAVKAVGGQ